MPYFGEEGHFLKPIYFNVMKRRKEAEIPPDHSHLLSAIGAQKTYGAAPRLAMLGLPDDIFY